MRQRWLKGGPIKEDSPAVPRGRNVHFSNNTSAVATRRRCRFERGRRLMVCPAHRPFATAITFLTFFSQVESEAIFRVASIMVEHILTAWMDVGATRALGHEQLIVRHTPAVMTLHYRCPWNLGATVSKGPLWSGCPSQKIGRAHV